MRRFPKIGGLTPIKDKKCAAVLIAHRFRAAPDKAARPPCGIDRGKVRVAVDFSLDFGQVDAIGERQGRLVDRGAADDADFLRVKMRRRGASLPVNQVRHPSLTSSFSQLSKPCRTAWPVE